MNTKRHISYLDDFFRLVVTLFTAVLAFGLNFTQHRGIIRLTIVLIFYSMALIMWTIGHLKYGDYEAPIKLGSWFFVSVGISMTYPTFFDLTRFGAEIFPFFRVIIEWIVLLIGLLIYLAGRNILKNSLIGRSAEILLWVPIGWTICYMMLIATLI